MTDGWGWCRVYTFKIRVYPPAILPMLAVYGTCCCIACLVRSLIHCLLVVTVATEAIGDITASCEVSRVAVEGPEFDSRIQGGILVRSVIVNQRDCN